MKLGSEGGQICEKIPEYGEQDKKKGRLIPGHGDVADDKYQFLSDGQKI